MNLLDLWQVGEPSRLDALWREHETLKSRVDALTELLIASGSITRAELDRALDRIAAPQRDDTTAS